MFKLLIYLSIIGVIICENILESCDINDLKCINNIKLWSIINNFENCNNNTLCYCKQQAYYHLSNVAIYEKKLENERKNMMKIIYAEINQCENYNNYDITYNIEGSTDIIKKILIVSLSKTYYIDTNMYCYTHDNINIIMDNFASSNKLIKNMYKCSGITQTKKFLVVINMENKPVSVTISKYDIEYSQNYITYVVISLVSIFSICALTMFISALTYIITPIILTILFQKKSITKP